MFSEAEDQKERERELVNAEMIPMTATKLTFWDKFLELQYKMLFSNTESVQNHMYSSDPLEWPFLTRGVAYWVSRDSNVSKAKFLHCYDTLLRILNLLPPFLIFRHKSISLETLLCGGLDPLV